MNNIDEYKVIIIQKNIRGYLTRKHGLPIFLQIIKKYLERSKIKLNKLNKDGRVNSCEDEKIIINRLKRKFG